MPFCEIYKPKKNDDESCSWHEGHPLPTATKLTCDAHTQKILYHDYTNDTSSKRSVVTEFNLVCNKYWSGRIVFHVVSGIGSCIGSIFIAVLADRCGRRPAMLLAMVTMTAGAVLETFMPDEYTVMIFTFFNSFGKWGLFQVSLVSGCVASFPTLATRST
jgi:hypothetical protein